MCIQMTTRNLWTCIQLQHATSLKHSILNLFSSVCTLTDRCGSTMHAVHPCLLFFDFFLFCFLVDFVNTIFWLLEHRNFFFLNNNRNRKPLRLFKRKRRKYKKKRKNAFVCPNIVKTCTLTTRRKERAFLPHVHISLIRYISLNTTVSSNIPLPV